jgi:hypothetical protein
VSRFELKLFRVIEGPACRHEDDVPVGDILHLVIGWPIAGGDLLRDTTARGTVR